MIYELAKQLKDAGFPQGEGGEHYLTCASFDDDENCRSDGHIAYASNLSELIEACGDKFEGLFNTLKYPHANKWLAEGYGEKCLGSTPEEAVAELWLALNKK